MTSAIKRVLLAEDEDDIREIVSAALEILGEYTVES